MKVRDAGGVIHGYVGSVCHSGEEKGVLGNCVQIKLSVRCSEFKVKAIVKLL